MDVIGYPHKQLGAEAYCYVTINAPIKCLTLNRLHKSLKVGRKNNQTKKTIVGSFIENILSGIFRVLFFADSMRYPFKGRGRRECSALGSKLPIILRQTTPKR